MAEAAINRCAVIGNPIAHSHSPQIHTAFAHATGIRLHYERLLAADEDGFVATVHRFFAEGGRGLNVTLPFKVCAAELAVHTEPYVRYAGAANTLWLGADGLLCADNTDGRGLVNALQHANVALDGMRILLIGAGGAAQGVYLPLQEAGVAVIDIANRTPAKAETILQRHNVTHARAYPLHVRVDRPYDVVINATSTGLSTALPLWPQGAIKAGHTVCYDMMYGKQTPFMQWALAQGAVRVMDGYGMLLEQARLSFLRWFGVLPPLLSPTGEEYV